jgi:myosin-5
LARKELKVLKAEARSVSKFKEISYRLENKVIELTQALQERNVEKKKLQSSLAELEQQLQQWVNRHEEADARAKQLQLNMQSIEAELTQRNEILASKADVEKKLEDALAKVAEKEAAIQKLTDDLIRQATQMETQQRVMDTAPVRNHEDSSVIMTLKNEVSSLREQLNRANALNSLTRGSRAEPPLSPTFAPGLRLAEANGQVNGSAKHKNQSHQRRHSSAGVFAFPPDDNRTSSDDILSEIKRNHNTNPRAVSVAFNGDENYMRFRSNGLPEIRDLDDPAEEKIRLMQDVKRLDEDVLDGLIRGLKIPAPSLTNPAASKEILFPANLISLVTNEMWKYGLIQESERFLANVMQTIQAHVMVNTIYLLAAYLVLTCIFFSPSLAKMRSFPASTGCQMSTKCCLSSALRRVTCSKVLVLARRMLSDHSTGMTTSASYRSSSMTSTALSTTFITPGCSKPRRNYQRW